MPSVGKIIELTGVIGSICSIIAFLLTIWIFFKLGRINRTFLFQARFPTLKKKLALHRSTLSRLLNTFPDSASEIAVEMQKCHATLESLKPKLDRARRSSVLSPLRLIKTLPSSSSPQYKEQVREVYLELVLLEGRLQNQSEDTKWRPVE